MPAVAKAALVKTSTAEVLRFDFNPKQLNATVSANYAKVAALGGTGQRLHFGHTSNFSIPLTIYMDRHALIARDPDNGEFLADTKMDDVQRYLLSCVFPVGRQNDPIRRAPPRLLFLWPGIMELPVRMISENFSFTKFEHDLKPWIYSVRIVMESDLSSTRITSDVIRIRGFQLAGYGG
jgi:hypothetical protein